MLSTFSNGSPCSRKFMRSSTTTMLTARSCWSVRFSRMRNTLEMFPEDCKMDLSKFVVLSFARYSILHFVSPSRLAKYLEVLNMPDEFRELLDEYMDASERSLGQKECREFFQCPYSLKESVKRNFSGNSL